MIPIMGLSNNHWNFEECHCDNETFEYKLGLMETETNLQQVS